MFSYSFELVIYEIIDQNNKMGTNKIFAHIRN